ncbi:nicotinate-nucleotide adenylyltransferase [Rhodococcus ruber]|uniref:nicotinate-nucleotide adenylyltransferase n=1 Tax=Rhodococcus TaxID=1827 RepID=UPI0002FB1665|nr:MULTISPECIES: nicotinate-nucleotide adenylyltransferase [Rhodococcus]MBP2212196.1 nicotinate-nucleotide adenylyltransferase [Rhodococcus ruber]MDO2380456.1 nicotinate-nucleotide adenylyltransferase [Rhodococcus ruber]WML65786.1 nicotinate-nucleotide adenylyltransferase [Rhodococcus sp. AH-ZY2]
MHEPSVPNSPPRRRVGVMGGTFDPIHHGHLVAASEVADRYDLDEVVFVPTGHPWQKSGHDVSTAEDRYLMTVIATASNPQFSVSRVDIEREKATYTVDTLRDLRALMPDAQLYFITGADAMASILSWQDWAELFELARFVGVSRPGYDLHVEHLAEHLAKLPSDTVGLVEIPALAISSTDCRTRVREHRPIWYLVPDGVVQYISKRNLYRPANSRRPDGTTTVSHPHPESCPHPERKTPQ